MIRTGEETVISATAPLASKPVRFVMVGAESSASVNVAAWM
jgi:hypothetical protein